MTGTPDNLSRSHKVVRVEREEGFGSRLRSFALDSKAKFVDVAKALGLTTNDLGDVFDGTKHARAAWMELLPPEVEQLYLAERALAHSMQLLPLATGEEAVNGIIAHVGQVLTLCGQAEQDGHVDVDETKVCLPALRTLHRKLGQVIAFYERAERERGLSVSKGTKR